MQKILASLRARCAAADAFLTRRRMLFGMLLSLLLAGALAVYNVSSGPLSNLNDIGGWSNRALFILLTAAVHGLVLVLCTALSRCSFARVALRQLILTAGYYILQMGINQKTYAFTQVVLPAIRTMQAEGLAAALEMDTGLSAFALLVIRALSSGPVYPMYMLKLMAMASMLVMAVLCMRAAEKNGLGVRTEALLALCMILPQGFMNAACSALTEVTAVTLLFGGFALADNRRKYADVFAGALMGMACALSGVCLYALPAAMIVLRGRRSKLRLLLAVLAVMAVAAAAAVLCGAPLPDTAASFLRANFTAPQYASGSPNLMNLIPRAAVEEMPQYAPILRHFDTLDTVTNAQQYYTQAHFEQMSAGFVLASLALYLGVCALVYRAKDASPLRRVMTLTLGALICCPNATAGAWLALDVLCLYALLAEPALRLPACLTLFATMTSSAYPMTEEVMLPMVYAFALCLAALCMLLGVIPMGKEKTHE